MHDIFDRLQALGKHAQVHIFFFGTEWSVKLEYDSAADSLARNKDVIRVERTDVDLETALRDAWAVLETKIPHTLAETL